MNRTCDEGEYILGSDRAEIERLDLQHSVWRDRVLALWTRAGFAPGQTIVDVGCGPGFATLDLADIVGPTGNVVAIDSSARFLEMLLARARERGRGNIDRYRLDLDTSPLPSMTVDAAWCRWVLIFLQRPREVVRGLADIVRPGGVVALHEYFDYGAWRTAPRCVELEEFVAAVMESWRARGSDADVALNLPGWLAECGFEVRDTTPIIDAVSPTSPAWRWLRAFVEVGRERLFDLGLLTRERSEHIWERVQALEQTPGTLMITPGVMEIVAVRR